MQRFTDKIVLVTGAARGIGRAAAEQFAIEGAAVVATDMDAAELTVMARELASQGLNIEFHRHDVTDPIDWDTVIGEVITSHGRLDVLVNNAGAGFLKT